MQFLQIQKPAIEVEAETAYSWKIIAVDSNGNKSDSGIYTFRTD